MWFDFWTNNIVCDLAPNTLRNYRERYKHNIQPVIGKMRITDAKQMHCKAILNRMHDDYAGSTIMTMDRYVHVTDDSLFSAVLQFEEQQNAKMA